MGYLITLLCRKWIAYLLVIIQIAVIVTVISRNNPASSLNNAIDLWFDKTDPTLNSYHTEQLNYGKNKWVIIAVDLDESKKQLWLSAVNKLTNQIESLQQINRVLSPTSFEVLKQTDNYLEYTPLFAGDDSQQEYNNVLNQLKRHPIAGNLLIHDKRESLWFLLAQESSDVSSGGFERQKLIEAIKGYITKQPAVKRFALTGPTVINAELNRLSWGDFLVLMPLTVLLACLALFVIVSGKLRLLLPLLLNTGLSTGFTLSLMLWLGQPFNMMTISLPGLIFCLGLASGIHLLHKFQENPHFKAVDIADYLWRPMLISHLTTSMGFLSLASIPIAPVQVMAIFGSVGIIIALVNSLIVLPHIIVSVTPSSVTQLKWLGYKGTAFLSQQVLRIFSHTAVNKQTKLSLYAFIAGAFVLIAWGISHLQFDSTYLDMVAEKEPMKQYYQTLDEFKSYSANMSILLNNNNNDGLLTVNDLETLKEVTRAIEKHPAVLKVLGPANIYDEISPFFPAEKNSNARVNDIFAFAIIGGSPDVADYVTADFSHLRLQVFFRYMPNNHLKIFLDDFLKVTLDDHIKGKSGLDYEISGLQVLWANMDEAVYDGQLFSVVIMFLLACLTFGLTLKKIRLTLVAVLINFVPILTILALFGIFSIEIDMATVFILGISLGIAIDDTAYFMCNFIKNRKILDAYQAIQKTLTETSPPVIATTLIISIGFIVLVKSNFVPMQKFGLFVSVGITAAMLADLILLPHLAYQLEKRRN